MTQRDLADFLGVPIWTVDRLETGGADPARYLPAIAEVTHRRVESFAADSHELAPAPSTNTPPREGRAPLGGAASTVVLGAIVLLITIRFFTEVVSVLPRAANFVDVPMVVALGIAAAAITRPEPSSRRSWHMNLALPALAVLALASVSTIANSSRIAPAPVLVFVYGFLAPVAVYSSVYRLWPAGNAGSLSRVIIALGALQLVVVAVIDLPRFFASDTNPDLISGTFGSNAYQLVFFLLIVATLLAGISTLEPRRTVARFAPFLLLSIFATILLAQYRALLATTVVALAVIALVLGRRARGLVAASLASVAFIAAFMYVSSSFPALKLESTATTLRESPLTYARERARVMRVIPRLYADEPSAALIGTGPGTFSSRAWQTFANSGSESRSNVQGAYARALTGGVYRTDVSDKYVRSQLREGRVVEGSRALSSPYSSYIALLAEGGPLLFALIVGMYVVALARAARVTTASLRDSPSDASLPPLALATTIAFLTLLQMALLENWLEVTRVTLVAWTMLAIVLKEHDHGRAKLT